MSYHLNRKEFKSKQEFSKRERGCATARPNNYQINRVDEELSLSRSRVTRPKRLTIPIQFTHITHGDLGKITQQQREQQVSILNNAFNSAGIFFEYQEENVRFIENPAWYFMGHRSAAEREAKTKLNIDPSKNLNFYTCGLEAGLLGWATFPFDLDGDSEMDGVVLLDGTLPGGNETSFNLGKTATHEIGHWLGLYHTFQGGCDAFGDHVGDTPAQSAPDIGQPVDGQRHNACNIGELSPIHNYMNYVDDAWMTEFTPKQEERMIDQVMRYRSELI
jgi:hypothetical protein